MFKKLSRSELGLVGVCLICATGMLLICTRSSPLYPFNNSIDANTYFTIGRGMLQGLVPYRDLIDQKGPYLFILQMLGAMVSRSSFLGVWLLEVVAATVFLYFSAKTIQLFCSRQWSFLSVPLLALFAYSCVAFSFGDTAEEFCLPLLAMALYLFCRVFQSGSNWRPTGWMFFANGVAAGIILWTKFTLLGLHFAWMAVLGLLLWFKDKQFKKAVGACLVFLIGMAAATLPILLYFGANHALSDLFQTYFYRNIFHYGSSMRHWSEPFYNMFMSGVELLCGNPAMIVLCGVGALAVLFDRRLFCVLGRGAFFTLPFFMGLFIWGATRGFPYYGLVFACFIPLGLIWIGLFTTKVLKLSPKVFRVVLAALLLLCFAAGYWLSPNSWFMQVKKADLPQTKFAEIINADGGKTLLNYGCLDAGFYTFANITPTCKYFCRLNLHNNEELELIAETMVKEGAFDFIVTANNPSPYVELNGHYVEVSTAYEPTHDGSISFYKLYKRIDG